MIRLIRYVATLAAGAVGTCVGRILDASRKRDRQTTRCPRCGGEGVVGPIPQWCDCEVGRRRREARRED